MLALQQHPHREGQLPCLHPEAQAVPILHHVQCPDGAALGGAEVCNALLRLVIQVPQQQIVAVEQQLAGGRHTGHNLHFRLADAILGAQKFNVGGADVDNHRYVRTGNVRKVGNLAKVVHAHLQHGSFGILRHGQHRHGHPDVVIVIGRGLAGDVSLLQHGGDHFLGGALAHGAGDRHHLRADAL